MESKVSTLKTSIQKLGENREKAAQFEAEYS